VGPQNPIGEVLLLAEHVVDPCLDRAAAHERKHEHFPLLPDTERPVGGLVFHGRVPPAIEMDHVRRGGEIEPRAPGRQNTSASQAASCSQSV
jgi:hypothetical protein